jgi:hypothetical protein
MDNKINPGKKYQVTALFSNKKLGVYSGISLKKGALKISLSPYGQDIIELAQVG